MVIALSIVTEMGVLTLHARRRPLPEVLEVTVEMHVAYAEHSAQEAELVWGSSGPTFLSCTHA